MNRFLYLIQLLCRHMSFIKLLCRIAWISILIYPIAAAADAEVLGLEDDEEAETNVKLTLSLAKEPCDSPEWKIRHLFFEAGNEIDEAMRAVGYYHSKTQKDLAFDTDCWQAKFKITPGPPVIIDRIDIVLEGEAKHDPEFQALLDKLKQELKSVLNHGRYEAMKNKIESLAMERGYFDNKFIEKKLLIDKERNTARIELSFDSGRRLLFGKVAIDQDILNPEFVEKFVPIKPGDEYNASVLSKTYNNLSMSGYFKSIDIRPELEQVEDLHVPIHLTLSPKKVHHYSIGLGYDTDKGPLLGASYANRRLNRQGHFVNFNLDFSPVLSVADAEYDVPLDDPLTDFFSFGGGLKRENTDTFDSLSAKLSARLKHTFESGWKQTLYVDEVYEHFKNNAESHDTLMLLPGGSWLRSVADNPLRPTRGYRLLFNLAGTYENPLSQISMAQGSMQATWMHPSPWNGRFILRSELGATTVSDFDDLPTTYRFYAGGMNSVRGYGYKELGPKDDDGNIIGGRFLSVVSVEYEQSILENWGVATFVDSGNAFNLDQISFKTGVGLGVRWYSPIGLVRVDFAVPLDPANESFRIHFAAGTRL
ncbi:autotransporter assembly complex protein TamA [Methylomonas sp. MgM2]